MRSEPEPDEKQETTIRLLSSRNPRQAQGSSTEDSLGLALQEK